MSTTLWLLLQEATSGIAPTSLAATIVGGPQVNLSWDATGIISETGYSIERRDVTTEGSFAEIGTVGPNISVYEGDVGPFTSGHQYAYRVVVVGGSSDGKTSNVVYVLGAGSNAITSLMLHNQLVWN